ncbi:DUF3500 domain-containing protein [bacterium]|nr:DUF3500 domain-containing protein [bacterium]
MNNSAQRMCPDCDSDVTRRRFLQQVGAGAFALGAVPFLAGGRDALAAPTATSAAETAVKRLYESLNEKQSSVVCLPFNHALRKKINANWRITEARISSEFLSNEQLAIVDDVLKGITSEEGYDKLQRQMKADAGGLPGYSFAIFGLPGTDQFEFELTGRHLTLRADGNSVPGAAFGGPIVYGHGVGKPSQNLFFNQTQQVNKVFQALDPAQAKQALVEFSPTEDAVALQGQKGKFPGLAVSDMSSDQQELVEQTLKSLLGVYRPEDVDEALAVLKQGGGLKTLHMAYYQDSDLEDDKVWDVWRIEGPSFVWHFRGDPHVHAYINIGLKEQQV